MNGEQGTTQSVLEQATVEEIRLLDEYARNLHNAQMQADSPRPISGLGESYQHWYSRALPLIHQLLPERRGEFEGLYHLANRKELNNETYTISDFLLLLKPSIGGVEVDRKNAFLLKFQRQIFILRSAEGRVGSILNNLRYAAQSDLFHEELDIARDLLEKGHPRAAGAISGVILERHLKQSAASIEPAPKKLMTIGDCNNALKEVGRIDVPTWRFIQRLGDVRNLCVHDGHRPPTKEEVTDLIVGTERILQMIN